MLSLTINAVYVMSIRMYQTVLAVLIEVNSANPVNNQVMTSYQNQLMPQLLMCRKNASVNEMERNAADVELAISRVFCQLRVILDSDQMAVTIKHALAARYVK